MKFYACILHLTNILTLIQSFHCDNQSNNQFSFLFLLIFPFVLCSCIIQLEDPLFIVCMHLFALEPQWIWYQTLKK